MFSIKDISDKQGLSKNPSTNATEHEISANINTKEGKKKEDEDFDKCWDEYDDQDEDDLSEEDIEKKDSNANNNNYYYSKQDYKYSKSYDYYGYKNNYSYGEKKYKKKKGGHKYQYDGYSNKNYQKHYTKDQGEYNYQNNNFMNTNSNYMRKPGSEYNNKYSNNNTYNNKYNSNKYKNYWKNKEDKDKNEEDIIIAKPMFTNSKLENNGNPEGNYLKIDVGDESTQKKNFNLVQIGEVPINENGNNSLLNMNLYSKESGQKIEESNNNINKDTVNADSGNLPWRNGGNNKKDYYNKKKDNYYYNNNKNYNNYKNKYPLNQPKSKKSNKFD